MLNIHIPDEKKYQRMLSKAHQVVDECAAITTTYAQFLHSTGIDLGTILDGFDDGIFERLRTKMKSQLINIVVCGAFSSGKSFLISGMINRLEWYKRPKSSDDFWEGETLDGYSSFLPSSPNSTSSCPLAVIPHGSSENRSRLEIFFSDTKTGEDKSEPYISEDDIARKMLTYVTEVAEWRSARPVSDLSRTVISANLYISNSPLPAIIHDLPGIGAVGEEYLSIVKESIRDADCVVYVASAIKELENVELDLLGFVQEIHAINVCPVFFVLSQIDKEAEWRTVLDKNNWFLKEYFKKDGKPNLGFIGQGFTPLSVALVAKARGRYELGEINEQERDQVIEKSGYPAFYQNLYNHLLSISGPTHLREVVVQAHKALNLIVLDIASRLEAETINITNAKNAIEECIELCRVLVEKRKALLDDLEDHGQSALLAGFSTSSPNELLEYLTPRIESFIKNLDVLKETNRHLYIEKIKEVRDEWLRRPDRGLEEVWNQAWNDYQKQTIILLNKHLAEAVKEAAISNISLLGSIRDTDPVSPKELKFDDTVKIVGDVWRLFLSATGIGAGGIITIGQIGVTAVTFGPLGFFLIVAGSLGLGWVTIKRKVERQKVRKDLLKQLPSIADDIIQQLRIQAEHLVDAHKGEIIRIINRLIAAQEEKRLALDVRLNTGDWKSSQERASALADFQSQVNEIDTTIKDFYTEFLS